MLSQPAHDENTAVSTIAFAEAIPGQEQGQVAEGAKDDSPRIQLEVLGDGTCQV